jgi:hypothetical protein
LTYSAAKENRIENLKLTLTSSAAALRQRGRSKIRRADQCLPAKFVSFVKKIEKNRVWLVPSTIPVVPCAKAVAQKSEVKIRNRIFERFFELIIISLSRESLSVLSFRK